MGLVHKKRNDFQKIDIDKTLVAIYIHDDYSSEVFYLRQSPSGQV